MTSFLAKVLANDHPLFTKTISDLERASGNSGVDTRLIADMTEAAHGVLRELGLDTADTSAQEVYQSLNAVVRKGDLVFLGSTNYVLLPFEDGPVSFNLLDVIENAHHQLSFEDRKVSHAQRQLRSEIIRRYAEHDRTNDEMVHNFVAEIGLKPEEDQHYVDIDHRLAAGGIATNDKSDTPNVLAIGDIFTDAFITLDESNTKIIKEADGVEWLALPFGRKPPYKKVDIVRSVGPSPNSAVSMARLGLNVDMMAWVGGDDVGREAIDHLSSEHIATDSMIVEADKATSYWYVLRYGPDRTMLVKSEKYKYEWVEPRIKPDWVYLSYIGEDSWTLHEALLEYLNANKSVKLAFQPGSFHFQWGTEKLKAIYQRSHIVVVNREEAVDITGAAYEDIHGLAQALHELGPKVVVITDGPNGSYASQGGKVVTIPNYPDPAPPFERTGAGDAFASTVVAALAMGESLETALTWAPINSMSVVQKLGAQAGLLPLEEIKKYLDSAPDDYVVTELGN